MQQMEEAIGSLGNAVNAVRGDVAELARDHAVLKRIVRNVTYDIQTDQTIDIVVGHLRRDASDLAQDYATFKKATTEAHAADLALEQARVNGFLLRPFLGRLRWLFTGK